MEAEWTKLQTTIERFCQFMEGLPEEALVPQEWGPREVLAHLLFWHESYVVQLESLLDDQAVSVPQGRYKDLNLEAAKMHRETPVIELVRRFREANERFCHLGQNPGAEALVLEIKKGSKRWPLLELVPAVESHVRNHQRKLARQLRRR